MSYFSVDVEADGPCPGLYSMVCFGAVLVKDHSKTFYGETAPISGQWLPDALAISGFSREQHTQFSTPNDTMKRFASWIEQVNDPATKPVFIADNNGFDWQFINYYFHLCLGKNPFGFSSRNLNDIYHGIKSNSQASFKHLRVTKHTHDPVMDAKGNAEAFCTMIRGGYRVKI